MGRTFRPKAVLHPDARMFGQAEGQRDNILISECFDFAVGPSANSKSHFHAPAVGAANGRRRRCGRTARARLGKCHVHRLLLVVALAAGLKIFNKTFAHTGGNTPG